MSDSRKDGGARLASAAASAVSDARPTVRFRVLPDGEFREVPALVRKGRILEIDLQSQDVALGSPLEIESDCFLYLGELYQRDGALGSVRVEHTLDRAKLAADRGHWG